MSYTIKILNCIPGECRSCYERKIRAKGLPQYNVDLILNRIDELIETEKRRLEKDPNARKCDAPCVHGGEPLIIPIDQLRKIFAKVLDYWGYNSIQTNGLLITDEHIDLFEQYAVHVGLSLDGDTAKMDRGRWNYKKHSEVYMQRRIDLVLENMRRARVIAGSRLSCIVVLRKFNASAQMIPELIRFIGRLYDEFGIWSGRTNPGVVYDPRLRKEEELTAKEFGTAMIQLADFIFSDRKLDWLPFHSIIDMLLGYLRQSCSFNFCDPFCTSGEMAINHVGNWTNCLHGGAATEGLQVLRADEYSNARYGVLKRLPQRMNGCEKCRYWFMCTGGCPGAGFDNDWRNKTRWCEGWKKLFSHIEDKLKAIMPNLNLTPEFYPFEPVPPMVQKSLRQDRGSSFKRENRSRIENILKEFKKEVEKSAFVAGHGDRPHGDRHGDHTDYARTK